MSHTETLLLTLPFQFSQHSPLRKHAQLAPNHFFFTFSCFKAFGSQPRLWCSGLNSRGPVSDPSSRAESRGAAEGKAGLGIAAALYVPRHRVSRLLCPARVKMTPSFLRSCCEIVRSIKLSVVLGFPRA